MIDRYLSYSQISAWQECKRAWEYRYPLGLRPKLRPLRFSRGSLIHRGLEYAIRNRWEDGAKHTWDDVLADWRKEWALGEDAEFEADFFDGCKRVVNGAFGEFAAHWQPIELDGKLQVEKIQFVSLPDYYKGVMFIPDTLCVKLQEPFAGGIFSVDFKSHAKERSDMEGDVDLQGAITQYGMLQKGVNCIGSCLFQVPADAPRPPRTNKDGSLHAGDVARNERWKPVLKQIVTHRSDELVENIWTQAVIPLAREIHDAEATVLRRELPPHLNYFGCQFCEYFEPCQARLKGLDESAIVKELYSVREKRQKGGTNAEKAS
jgi:hypothetical protein